MRRVGRTPTPAERGYQLVAENPEVLDRAARNLYAATNYGKFPGDKGATGLQIDSEWAGLQEWERELWRRRALEKMKAHAEGKA